MKMEYYTIVGMVLVCLIAIYTAYMNIKKNTENEEIRRNESLRATHELNINIVKLTASIDSMQANDLVRDKRLNKHGEEIDSLDCRLTKNEHITCNHETRIKTLEERGRKNDSH